MKNNTRKFMRMYFLSSGAVWSFVALSCLLAALGSPIAAGVAVLVSLAYALLCLGIGFSLDQSGLNDLWFKTQTELKEMKDKNYREWEKAIKLIHILGEQEAIKLWNQQKQKENDTGGTGVGQESPQADHGEASQVDSPGSC